MYLGSEDGMKNKLAFNLLMIVVITIILCLLAGYYEWKAQSYPRYFTIEGN